jgi:ABC-type sulfate/molybdate transport systems ATPase subunit
MEKEIAEKVDRLVTIMRLSAFANKFVSELSTGSRRIVDLACTLAHDPEVLLLDEPSSGIAQRETEALGPVLLDICDETEAAIVVIEHDMPLITGISDQIVALELGAVIARGTPEQVLSDAHVVASYLGTTEATINRSGDAAIALATRQVADAAGRSRSRRSGSDGSNGQARANGTATFVLDATLDGTGDVRRRTPRTAVRVGAPQDGAARRQPRSVRQP